MILFSEKQKFRQWWIWLILLFPFATAIFRNYQVSHSFQLELKQINLIELIPVLIISLLFWIMSLKTEITTEGVSVQFFPIHFKPKFFPWQNIKSIYVRKYKPFLEYGGWGLRIGLYGRGMAYNVSGNIGIQMKMVSSKKILIGTKHPEEVKFALQKAGKLKIEDIK